MRKMEQALKEEDSELSQQARILEIERFENDRYPEAFLSKGEATLGNDAFSKEMETNGLRHITGCGSERRIRHTDLPDELDLFVWAGDQGYSPVRRASRQSHTRRNSYDGSPSRKDSTVSLDGSFVRRTTPTGNVTFDVPTTPLIAEGVISGSSSIGTDQTRTGQSLTQLESTAEISVDAV
jgi:hypothetical protein